MPSDSELKKKLTGGQITKAEYDRLMAMPHEERYGKSGMKRPESGGKPKRITASGPPGGPHTPGAKLEKQKAQAGAMRVKRESY